MAVDKLVDSTVLDGYFEAIADAIRDKNGTANAYTPAQMPQAIEDIPTGITPTGTISITQNGTVDVTNYASANVNVPSGGGGNTDLIDLIERDITSIEIPSVTTIIGYYAFSNCSRLTSVNIPSSVLSIGNYAFSNCSALTSANIPSSVTNIGDYAFNGCSALTSVNIPSGVTNIGSYTFSSCEKLTSIDFPSGVTNIGGRAFSGCTRLTSITVRATTPPTITANSFQNVPANANIYVPSASVETYKTANNWSSRAAYIQAIPE